MDLLTRLHKLAEDQGFHVSDELPPWARENLEFFPDCEPRSGREEYRVGRDYSKQGFGPELLSHFLGKPITEDMLRRIHYTDYCTRAYSFAPHYRDLPVRRIDPRGSSVLTETYYLKDPPEIPQAIKELIDWVNSEEAMKMHPLKRATLFYMRLDQIHPFLGRTKHLGRFFSAKIAFENGFIPPINESNVGFVCFERPATEEDFFASLDFRTIAALMQASNATCLEDVFSDRPRTPNAPQLIMEKAEDEYLLYILSIYFTNRFITYYRSSNCTTQMKKTLKEIQELLLAEASEFGRGWLGNFTVAS